jgi:hypothetical protein
VILGDYSVTDVKQQRLSWDEFLDWHEKLQGTHPSKWAIDWARLPKTIERDRQKMPVYLKAGRTLEAACILMYTDGRMVARRYRTDYWETFDYGLAGHVIRYRNSLDADVRRYWGLPYDEHPLEIHSGFHRWVRVHYEGTKALYWCAFTGQFKDEDHVFNHEDLWEYFGHGRWGNSLEEDEVYNKARVYPSTTVGRMAWRLTHRDPGQGVVG